MFHVKHLRRPFAVKQTLMPEIAHLFDPPLPLALASRPHAPRIDTQTKESVAGEILHFVKPGVTVMEAIH